MTKETKVGVVVGLFIVVVASAYFYGNAREDDEFLVASRDGIPSPQIPVSREKKDTPPAAPSTADAKYRLPPGTVANMASAAGATDKSGSRGPRTSDGAGKPNGDVKSNGDAKSKSQPVQLASNPPPASPPANSGSTETAPVVSPNRVVNVPSARDALTWVPPKPPESASPETTANGGAPAAHTTPPRGNFPPDSSSTVAATPMTPLRTSASDSLTRSTLANLEAANAAVPRVGADLGAIGESIRTGREAPLPPPSPAGASNARTASANSMGRPALDAGTPRSQPPAKAWPKQHTVEENDTLYELAMDYYNDPGAVNDLKRANPKSNPNNLKLGTVLIIPQRGAKSAGSQGGSSQGGSTQGSSAVATRGPSSPASSPPGRSTPARVEPTAAAPGTYTVREGETFYAIARKLYGNSKRSQELFELNKALVKGRPERLKEGMVLRLPAN